MERSAQQLYEECRQELESARVHLALIRKHCLHAIHHGAAFGGELALAQRILAVLDQDQQRH